MTKFRYLIFVSGLISVILIGCEPQCTDIPYPSYFTQDELSKFPIFNKFSNSDSIKATYEDERGRTILLNIRLGTPGQSGHDNSYAFKNSSIECQRVAYRKISFSIDSLKGQFFVFTKFPLIKHNVSSEFKSKFSDSVSVSTTYHYIGDTIINNKQYQKCFGFNGYTYTNPSYFVANLQDGLIYFNIPDQGKKYYLK